MTWSAQKTRIRRYLRDPDGNIWSDALLLNLHNKEQDELNQDTGILEGIQALRVPPRYAGSYMHDNEWPYRQTTGKNFQCMKYHHQSDAVVCHEWEGQVMAGIDASTKSIGDVYSHPWESWYGSTTENVPIWFPPDFSKAKFVSWDREPISYLDRKNLQSDDPSWRTRSGEPFGYMRTDALSNEFYLYPRPSSPVWDDDTGTGPAAIFEDSDTVSGDEDVLVTTRTGSVFNADAGIATDIVRADDNVLMIYDATPTDAADDDSESDYPVWMQKYIEYGATAEAYRANTDGRIESLGDYWEWRRELGVEMIKKFKGKRKVDRDYRLISQDGQGQRVRREPRLPDAYPAVYR